MKLRLFILLTFALISFEGFSQESFTLTGTITDKASNDPMPFATVFFAETTFGTVSGENGEYKLTVPKPGTYDLIVKFVGYKTFALQVKLGEAPVATLDITIEADTRNLGSVVVSAKKDKDWERHMQEFRTTFLGESQNARKCKILNEQDIDFFYDKKKVVLEAFSSEPIIIENKALGYRVKYYLEKFVINYTAGLSTYYGYTIFEEMDGSKNKKARWEKNRRKAYEGSAIHFFTSLYENRLTEEGFYVQVAKDVSGFGRVINPRDANVFQFLKEGSNDISKSLPFENFLYITYEKEFESKEYQEAQSRRISLGHSSISKINKKPQQSWISIMEGYESIEFEPSGYIYDPTSFYSAGYWGFEKIADMVPINYRPKKKD